MKRDANKVTFKGEPITLLGNEIKPGDQAPDFSAINNELKPVHLKDFKNKVKVISVFPSIDTGVCSKQNKTFDTEASKLSDYVVILAVSNDLPFALQRYCGAEGINNLVTLSDHKDVDFGTKYGFLIEELRLLARGVIVIDKNDKVAYVEYVPEIGQEPDYDSAIEAAKKLV
ncbi:MAG: thiol peroxidase [Bacteroidales bacterium]